MALPEGGVEPGSAPPAGPVRDVGVVVPAAGSGVRFGGKKAFLLLAGQPLVLHSLKAFAAVADVLEVVVAVQAEDLPGARESLERFADDLARAAGMSEPPRFSAVAGGDRRQDSVAQGLAALGPRTQWALVHDAARPLVRPDDIRKLIAAVRKFRAAALGHPASDSIKEEKGGWIARDLPRGQVWQVQTPQGAALDLLRRASDEGKRRGLQATDEAGLLAAIGEEVRLVEGERTNIKITFPRDLELAEHILKTFPRPLT